MSISRSVESGTVEIEMSVSISKIIFLAGLAASYYICEDVNAVQYSDFVEIENYLTKTVAKHDLQPNLKAANDWLAKLKKSKGSKSLLEALELFTSMSNTLKPDSCNRKGFHILMQNELATLKKSRLIEDEIKVNPPLRVHLLVNQVCKQHAKLCFSAHIANFKAAYASLDKTTAHRVETFTDLLIEDHYLKRASPDKSKSLVLYEALKQKPDVSDFRDAKLANEALEALAKEDPAAPSLWGSQFLDRDEIRGIFDKYLVEPCREYYRKLGPEVFKPAQFDQVYEPQFNEKEVEFYTGWVRYALCEQLILIDDWRLLGRLADHRMSTFMDRLRSRVSEKKSRVLAE